MRERERGRDQMLVEGLKEMSCGEGRERERREAEEEASMREREGVMPAAERADGERADAVVARGAFVMGEIGRGVRVTLRVRVIGVGEERRVARGGRGGGVADQVKQREERGARGMGVGTELMVRMWGVEDGGQVMVTEVDGMEEGDTWQVVEDTLRVVVVGGVGVRVKGMSAVGWGGVVVRV